MQKNCVFKFKNKKILLDGKGYLMGILNITPDSFSDGGEHFLEEDALNAAIEIQKQGTDFIDVGAQSTRPGSISISPEEEWSRLERILPLLVKKLSVPISVDTFYPEVAEKALSVGVDIINDVSGEVNIKMAELVKKYSAGWILMDNKGGEKDILNEVHNRLLNMAKKAEEFGVKKENICLDAGIGFGKTNEESLNIIANTEKVKVKGYAYLLGLSRKRAIGSTIKNKTNPNERDVATVAANMIGLFGGTDIIRVHNCKIAAEALSTANALIKRRV